MPMDEKMGKRKPMFARKPSLVVAVETATAKKPEPAPETESEAIVCPKCGMELADTPANREYAKMRAEESDDESENEYEDED